MQFDLSILICTLTEREEVFKTLQKKLLDQVKYEGASVEILFEQDAGQLNVGAKRNKLIGRASGEYVCFVDDDDTVSPKYIALIIDALEDKPDCVGISGIYTKDWQNPCRFDHSIQYTQWSDKTVNGSTVYFRPPNHLNPIRREIAERFKFPEKNFGEDKDWCFKLRDAKVLRKESVIYTPIYYYQYSSRNSATVGR